MNGDEQRDEIRGYAHIDGEVESLPSSAQDIAQQQAARQTTEYRTQCPKCGSIVTYCIDAGGDRWGCRDCAWEWDVATTRGGTLTGAGSTFEIPMTRPELQEAVAQMQAALNPVVKDRTKARFDLLPWGPLWAMAEVMTNGAKKPGRVAHNWRKGTNWSDYFGAMMRHAALYQQGEDFDVEVVDGVEVKQYHLACVMCCAAILLEYSMFGLGTDDRFPAGHPAYKGGTR